MRLFNSLTMGGDRWQGTWTEFQNLTIGELEEVIDDTNEYLDNVMSRING